MKQMISLLSWALLILEDFVSYNTKKRIIAEVVLFSALISLPLILTLLRFLSTVYVCASFHVDRAHIRKREHP